MGKRPPTVIRKLPYPTLGFLRFPVFARSVEEIISLVKGIQSRCNPWMVIAKVKGARKFIVVSVMPGVVGTRQKRAPRIHREYEALGRVRGITGRSRERMHASNPRICPDDLPPQMDFEVLRRRHDTSSSSRKLWVPSFSVLDLASTGNYFGSKFSKWVWMYSPACCGS